MREKIIPIKARLSKNERKLFDEKLRESKLTQAAFIRKACLHDEVINVVDPELLKKIYAEINRLGSNINQIAHLANTNKSISDAELRLVIGWQQELEITVSRELKGVRKK